MNNVKKECKVCIHRDTCTLENSKNCGFEPIEKVKEYFSWGEFRPEGDLQIPTLGVSVGERKIKRCPYCGDQMFLYEKYSVYDSFTYFCCCLCDGALAEREYVKKRNALTSEYYRKQRELREEYEEQLKFNGMEKIIDLKLELEKDDLMHHRHYNEVFENLDKFNDFENKTMEI